MIANYMICCSVVFADESRWDNDIRVDSRQAFDKHNILH